MSAEERVTYWGTDHYVRHEPGGVWVGARLVQDHETYLGDRTRPGVLDGRSLTELLHAIFSLAKADGSGVEIRLDGQVGSSLSVDGRAVSVAEVQEALGPLTGGLTEQDAQELLVYVAALLEEASNRDELPQPTTTFDQRSQMGIAELGQRLTAATGASTNTGEETEPLRNALLTRLLDRNLGAADMEQLAHFIGDNREAGYSLLSALDGLLYDSAPDYSHSRFTPADGRLSHLLPLVPVIAELAGVRRADSDVLRRLLLDIGGTAAIAAANALPTHF